METGLSLQELVEKLNWAVTERDYDSIKRCARMLGARFDKVGDLSYAAQRLFLRMDEWSKIKEGSVDTVKMLEILREEGVEL
jgi:KaiC/GvpD/RAD55 family RecA-like ATPase